MKLARPCSPYRVLGALSHRRPKVLLRNVNEMLRDQALAITMVGNLSKKCQDCGKIITHGNAKRHNDRRHTKSLELRSTLSEVLESCNIPQELWPAEREVLDRLLNYRLLEDRTTSFDMPGEHRLQIFDDDHLGQALPSLEEVVVRVAAAVGYGCAQTGRVPKDLVGRNATTDRFNKKLISVGRILDRRETQPVTRQRRRTAMAQQNVTEP